MLRLGFDIRTYEVSNRMTFFYPALEQEIVPNNLEGFRRLFFYKDNKITLQISSINF